MAGQKGICQSIQLLRGKKASNFCESVAGLVEKYLDALDMVLADDITDRALQAHMADVKAAKRRRQQWNPKAEIQRQHKEPRACHQTDRGSARVLWPVQCWCQHSCDRDANQAIRGGAIPSEAEGGSKRGLHRQHAEDDRHNQCFCA